MMSPADSFSPKAASVLATCATMSTSLPVSASGSLVRAASAPRRMTREVRPSTLPPARVLPPKHDVALVDVAREHGVEIVRRRRQIEIGKLDRRRISLIAAMHGFGRRAAAEIARHAHADFRLGHRLDLAFERHGAAGQQQRALHQEADQRRLQARASASRRARPCRLSSRAAFRRRRCGRAGSASCAVMPLLMSGASQAFIACGSRDALRSRNLRSSRRPSSPRPAPRLRSRCC